MPASAATDPGRARLRLDVTYDGTQFSGWARQPGRRTVQGELEQALARVLRTERAPLTCAGRTDAGVHARGQVCHVDVASSTETALLERRLTRALPPDLRVRRVAPALEGFDARFSALWRRYVYRVSDDPASADPLRRAEVLSWRRPLDAAAMTAAAERLLGEHDFAAYCRRRPGATTIRTLLQLTTRRTPCGLLETDVVADAFCHGQVRALMGALLAVGEGRFDVEEPARILAAGLRDPRVSVVAPHGLTLEEVGYPPADQLAERARQSRAVRTLTDAP